MYMSEYQLGMIIKRWFIWTILYFIMTTFLQWANWASGVNWPQLQNTSTNMANISTSALLSGFLYQHVNTPCNMVNAY